MSFKSFEEWADLIADPSIQAWLAEHRGISASGHIKCPKCHVDGSLRLMSSVYKRGGGGNCRTKGCLMWIS